MGHHYAKSAVYTIRTVFSIEITHIRPCSSSSLTIYNYKHTV
jgi:hypothetical protein